jgi:hypothetical protein
MADFWSHGTTVLSGAGRPPGMPGGPLILIGLLGLWDRWRNRHDRTKLSLQAFEPLNRWEVECYRSRLGMVSALARTRW